MSEDDFEELLRQQRQQTEKKMKLIAVLFAGMIAYTIYFLLHQ